MATSYVMHLTDPFSDAFSVSAYTSNGPIFPLSTNLDGTAVSANTSFVFYGKGYPNYGERIQENILHLLENFSGAAEPRNAVSGQLWFRRYDHIRTGSGWYKWDDATSTWNSFTTNAGTPTLFVHGEYWLSGSSLSRVLNLADHPMSPTTIPLVWDNVLSIGDPNVAAYKPRKVLMVFNGEEWISTNNVTSSDVEPPTASIGDLWFDTATQQLKVFDGAFFFSTADQYLPLAGGTLTGPLAVGGQLNMSTNKIINVVDPTNPQDAATMAYVDAEIAAVIAGTATDLALLGDVEFGGAYPVPGAGAAFLKYNAGTSKWNASTLVFNDLSDIVTSGVAISDLQQLIGVTSPLQAQIDGKLNLTGGTLSADLYLSFARVRDVADPIGAQDVATKAYVDAEIALVGGGGGGTDIYLQSATLDSLVGSATEGYLDLTMSDASVITVAGFAVQGHTHSAEEVTHTPLSSSLLSQISPPVTNVKTALFQLEEVVRRRTSPRRSVYNVPAPSTGPFPTPEYEPGRDKLQVYLNGVKQIGDFMAFDIALFSALVDGSTDTGLAGSSSYQFTVNVDGGGASTITINTPVLTPPDVYTFDELVFDINALLVGATCVFEDGEMRFYSDTHGATASLVLGDISLFSAITGITTFSGFLGGSPGADYGYRETGTYGDTSGSSNTITTLAAIPAGAVFEFIVLGDSGLP